MLPPRAYKFLFLNAIRVLSIIALLLEFSSNIVVMVEDVKAVHSGDQTSFNATNASGVEETYECDYYADSTVPNQSAGVFWAVINRLFILGMTILMILSEIGWPEKVFSNYMPVLGPDFGVGVLGGVQWITSASILSHHVDEFPLVAAWFLFAIGCINILLGLFFKAQIKTDRSIMTFRDAKAKELLPGPLQNASPHFKILETSVSSIFEGEKNVSRNHTGGSATSNPGVTGYGFGRQGEKAAGLKGFMISRPVESLPRYAPRPPRPDSPEGEKDNRSRSPSPARPSRI